ncbi:hypothetical protein [Arthrobacter globiformis]|uniref:hypothetical protein n=1 Tax=Arthrobacter globiformis TaxID=1665 RepID=UPI0027D81F8C|nr:hypothetical protein [Arthrobacter globiformis]
MKKSSGRLPGPQSAAHQAGGRALGGGQLKSVAPKPHALRSDAPKGDPLKAMSPGVVDYLFRQLVAGEPPEDVQWNREGIALSVQGPGAELARRLSETDLDALTPTELFHYVRAAQRLSQWAESLREAAVERYCSGPESA